MPDLPPLDALRVFEAAARLSSFKAAAEELCVTPSAVSHQVAHLESVLKTPLFQLWALFATPAEREATFARAKAGGLGYGELKKDLLARLLAHFEPLREKREAFAKDPDAVEDVLAAGAARARAIAAPVLSDAREASGLGAAPRG